MRARPRRRHGCLFVRRRRNQKEKDDDDGRLFVCVVKGGRRLAWCVVNDGQGRRRDDNGGRLVCVVKGEGGVTLECTLKVAAN